MNPALSKSRFLRGLQCSHSLWLYVHKPELLPSAGETEKRRLEEGKEVGRIARELFPGGKDIVYEEGSLKEKAQQTAKWIEEDVSTIYEATFLHDDVVVMVDILNRGDEGWEVYEVKTSTSVKDIHIDDVGIQYYVLKGTGIIIEKASVVYINNQYVREGDLEISDLFKKDDVTERVLARQEFISEQLNKIRILAQGDEPDIDIGPHCDNFDYCGFEDHCWAHVPEYSIFDISRIGKKKWDLYRGGIIDFKDIPKDYELSDNQEVQVETELTGKEILDKRKLQEFLDSLFYPLLFLDFETVAFAIPPFDGIRPHQKIPFQFSLHSLDCADAELKHEEFLGTPGEAPRPEIADQLATLIPDDACVLAYNMSFEKGVIKDLAEQFPRFREKMTGINDNMRDLMIPFQKKHYYTKEMKGKYSIKNVLPALVPELSYEGMTISDGLEASNIYGTLGQVKDEKTNKKIRQNLLEYCELDTLAMVKLLEKLREVA